MGQGGWSEDKTQICTRLERLLQRSGGAWWDDDTMVQWYSNVPGHERPPLQWRDDIVISGVLLAGRPVVTVLWTPSSLSGRAGPVTISDHQIRWSQSQSPRAQSRQLSIGNTNQLDSLPVVPPVVQFHCILPSLWLWLVMSWWCEVNQTGPPPCRGLFRGFASPAILCHNHIGRLL